MPHAVVVLNKILEIILKISLSYTLWAQDRILAIFQVYDSKILIDTMCSGNIIEETNIDIDYEICMYVGNYFCI